MRAGVLHVSYAMGIGGAERALYQLVRAQAERGLGPELAVLSESGCYGRDVASLGVPVHDLRQRHALDWRIASPFLALAARHRVVHFHCPTPVLQLAAGRSGRVATAYTHRGGELRVPPRRRLTHWVTGRLVRAYAHAVSGNTRHAAECARRTYGLPQAEVLVTYNGIDFGLLAPRRPRADVLRELGEDPAAPRPRIGTSGNLRPLKRVELLLRAVAALPDRSLACYIIGDGPSRAALERLAASLGIAERVRFLGMQLHVGDYLQILDGFALLSDRAESFGNSAVEAMGLGIPTVVMADGGGLLEHFPPDHPPLPASLEELTRHLEGWFRDPARTGDLARRCREHVRERYTIGRMVDAYEALYAAARAAFERGGRA